MFRDHKVFLKFEKWFKKSFWKSRSRDAICRSDAGIRQRDDVFLIHVQNDVEESSLLHHMKSSSNSPRLGLCNQNHYKVGYYLALVPLIVGSIIHSWNVKAFPWRGDQSVTFCSYLQYLFQHRPQNQKYTGSILCLVRPLCCPLTGQHRSPVWSSALWLACPSPACCSNMSSSQQVKQSVCLGSVIQSCVFVFSLFRSEQSILVNLKIKKTNFLKIYLSIYLLTTCIIWWMIILDLQIPTCSVISDILINVCMAALDL